MEGITDRVTFLEGLKKYRMVILVLILGIALLAFPEKKRNLIYIVLESIEVTYADEENGGAFSNNVIDTTPFKQRVTYKLSPL